MASRINILVTGSNGQLGSELKELAPRHPNLNFVFFSRSELSITDKKALKEVFQLHQPNFFINCAAYTAVDKAEEEREVAFDSNGRAVGMIAELCREKKCRLIHISTDYVFNGESRHPLRETDAVDPVNVYGESKLLGELLALKNNPDTVIIRTSWVYSYYGKNFVKTMMRLMKEKESLGVVNDQVGSPTYAADLAEAILQIVHSAEWVPGIYHYSNEGVISWFDFASEIRALTHASCTVNPVTTEQFPTPAKRPAYSVLDKTKIQTTYHLSIKDWKESLRGCINKIQSS